MFMVLNYSGVPVPEAEAALWRAVGQCHARGWETICKKRVGDSILPRARNNTLADFLMEPATDLICLDDDVSWDSDEVMRLLDAPVDFVAGIYPAKMDEPRYYVRYKQDSEIWADEHGLIEVEGVPAGFMRLTRGAVERLSMAFPHLQYDDDTVVGGRAWALFNYELRHNRFWGEDYIFCDRWREIGGKIYVDPMLTLHHHGKPDIKTGEKKVFTGCFGDWMREALIPKKEAA